MQNKRRNEEKPRSKDLQLILTDTLLRKSKDAVSSPNLRRPKTSQAKNIHTIGLMKKRSLKRFSFKNQKIATPNPYSDCRDIISIKTLGVKAVPKTTNHTPTRGFYEEDTELNAREISRSDISDESASIYYPNEPKIHMTNKSLQENEKKNNNKNYGEIVINEKVNLNKKVIIKKPRIVITTKDAAERSVDGSKDSKFEAKPMKNISDLIMFTHAKVRPKGRVRRGLCININKSPVPRILRNIKLTN